MDIINLHINKIYTKVSTSNHLLLNKISKLRLLENINYFKNSNIIKLTKNMLKYYIVELQIILFSYLSEKLRMRLLNGK